MLSERSGGQEARDEWQLLHDAMIERLRHEVESCKRDMSEGKWASTAQVNALKGLVERQMRTQIDVEEALRLHTRTITREVCDMMKQYVHAKLKEFADGCDRRFVMRHSASAAAQSEAVK